MVYQGTYVLLCMEKNFLQEQKTLPTSLPPHPLHAPTHTRTHARTHTHTHTHAHTHTQQISPINTSVHCSCMYFVWLLTLDYYTWSSRNYQ